MIVLTSTTQVVRAVLNAAHTTNPLRCVTTWGDATSSAFTEGSTWISSNGTTPVEIVPAPAASTQRIVKYMSIFNSDTTAKTVTISAYDGSTDFTLFSCTLLPGEKIEFGDWGFRVMTPTGAEKQVSVTSGWNVVTLASDVTNNNGTANTIADVTGLSFPVVAGSKYAFRFAIDYTSAATTTGSRWSISGPASPTRLSYYSRYATSGGETVNHGLSAYDMPSASNTGSAATAANLAVVEGIITPSASGVVTARFASEVSSSAIVAKAGSYVEWMQVA